MFLTALKSPDPCILRVNLRRISQGTEHHLTNFAILYTSVNFPFQSDWLRGRQRRWITRLLRQLARGRGPDVGRSPAADIKSRPAEGRLAYQRVSSSPAYRLHASTITDKTAREALARQSRPAPPFVLMLFAGWDCASDRRVRPTKL